MISEMEILEEVQKFENDFIRAGELACNMRKTAVSSQKQNTGFSEIDIVTSADLAVQEFVLLRLAKSDLINCELIAEEDTPSTKLFAKKAKYVLTLDPIDGTKLYATGQKMFSIVVTIHNKKRPIYTFCYYPAVNWGVKIVNDTLKYLGKKPKLSSIHKTNSKLIGYWDRPGKFGPQKTDLKLYKKLIDLGYQFISRDDVSVEANLKAPFLLGMISGEFIENDSAVDSLTDLHFAIASGMKIFNHYDLSKSIENRPGNYQYKGYYFVLR